MPSARGGADGVSGKEQGDVTQYAQTNIQLLNQMRLAGYPVSTLKLVCAAYELAMKLFAGMFRPSGKVFTSHLVGTASILASFHQSIEIVVAGLLHAAYTNGDFGGGLRRKPHLERLLIRQVVGDAVEERISRYATLSWNTKSILSLRADFETLDQQDRDVLLIRLANELEDYLDLGVLYCCDYARRAEHIACTGAAMIGLAERLDTPRLGAELARVFEETASTTLPAEIAERFDYDRVFTVAPLSYRRMPSALIRDCLTRGRSQVRSLLSALRRTSACALARTKRGTLR